MKLKGIKKDVSRIRAELWTFYLNKYYNIFQNRFKWEGIEEQAKEFIMRQLWSVGTIACFKIAGTEGSTDFPQGMPVFTPYAPNGWNIYDYPISVNLINRKGVRFIPYTPQKVDEDVVIGWILRNHKAIKELIYPKLEQLIEAEMVIRSNLNAQRMPYLLVGDEESKNKLSALFDNIMNDEESLYLNVEDSNKIKLLLSQAPYIIDKLYNYKMCLENEIREILGVDNLGVGEKKEHLISNEIEANNQVIETSRDIMLDCLTEFVDRIYNILGITITVSVNQEEKEVVSEEGDEEDDSLQD